MVSMDTIVRSTVRVQIKSGDSVARLTRYRLFLLAQCPAFGVGRHHPIALGVLRWIGKKIRAPAFFPDASLTHSRDRSHKQMLPPCTGAEQESPINSLPTRQHRLHHATAVDYRTPKKFAETLRSVSLARHRKPRAWDGVSP